MNLYLGVKNMRNLYNGLLVIMLFSVALFSGCHGGLSFQSPEKQFIFIEENISVLACVRGTDKCINAGNGKALASGVLVSHSSKTNKSYYMTAGHVCNMTPPRSGHPQFELKADIEMHLLNKDGKDIIAEIVAIDEDHDICLISSKRSKHPPAIIEKRKLRKHIQVINVAAPAGIWSKNVMLHFFGEFQGNFKGAHEELPEEVAMYTITAQPGSSGSPVYDPATGRLVGMITSVLTPSYDIAFGPTLEQINEFLDANLP